MRGYVDINSIKIDKDIPLPKSEGGGLYRNKIESMEPGQSILLPLAVGINVVAGIYNAGRLIGIKIRWRKLPEGYRVWRIT